MALTASLCVMSNPISNSRVSFFEAKAKVQCDSDAAARSVTSWHIDEAAHHLRAGHKRVSTTKSKV